MFFDVALYISLVIFAFGLSYKISTWFRHKIGILAREIPTSKRVSAAFKGILSTLFSAKILTLVRVFVLDVVLQIRVLRADFLRWLMHMCIWGGLMLLLLMHALESLITSRLFPDYYSTINPFMCLN